MLLHADNGVETIRTDAALVAPAHRRCVFLIQLIVALLREGDLVFGIGSEVLHETVLIAERLVALSTFWGQAVFDRGIIDRC